jgi:adenylate cyclase class 2
MGPHLESEIKLQCADVDALMASHADLGWEIAAPRHFEDNFVYEMPAEARERHGSILRIRVAGDGATLTYKGTVPESFTSDLKVREEIETAIADPEALAGIFERLGLKRFFRYQKYRTVYRITLDGAEVLVMRDETPLGNFLEIEGDSHAAEALASRLGFTPDRYVRESYIGIQAMLCRVRGVPLQDLLFEALDARRQTSAGSR